jgi:hypothetical protein
VSASGLANGLSDIMCDTHLKGKATVDCCGGAGSAEERCVDVNRGIFEEY